MRGLLRRRGGRFISLGPAKEAAKALLFLAAAIVALAISAAAAAFGGVAARCIGDTLDAAPEVGRDLCGALPAGGDEVDGGEVRQGLPLAPQVLDDCDREVLRVFFFFRERSRLRKARKKERKGDRANSASNSLSPPLVSNPPSPTHAPRRSLAPRRRSSRPRRSASSPRRGPGRSTGPRRRRPPPPRRRGPSRGRRARKPTVAGRASARRRRGCPPVFVFFVSSSFVCKAKSVAEHVSEEEGAGSEAGREAARRRRPKSSETSIALKSIEGSKNRPSFSLRPSLSLPARAAWPAA